MKVVIDTNIILNAVYRRSKNYWIRRALENGQLTLCVTTDILDEYSEVLASYYDSETAELFLSALEILPNLEFIHKYYFWQLIPKDEDDEKFVDCAIAANADYLVTNDKHFSVLKRIEFPKVNVVNGTEFKIAFEAKFANDR
jgi:putative PIN family toxin of toxin-antitoxin system